MKIVPDEIICESLNLIPDKQYEVLDILNDFGECEVDLSFKIKNEKGKEIWVEDWDCTEIPRVNRRRYM